MMNNTLSNTIIYLMAFAGTGKYTIAKELIKKADLRLVDNHLINNPIFNVIEQDGVTPISEKIWQKVALIRKAVFDTIATVSPSHLNFIFTNELLENDDIDKKIWESILSVAHQRNAAFYPIRLICSADELQRRVVSDERKNRFKSINAARAAHQVKNETVFNPAHPNLLTLDVTEMTAENAAQSILEHVLKQF